MWPQCGRYRVQAIVGAQSSKHKCHSCLSIRFKPAVCFKPAFQTRGESLTRELVHVSIHQRGKLNRCLLTHLARRRLALIQLRAGVRRPAVSTDQRPCSEYRAQVPQSQVAGQVAEHTGSPSAENLPLRQN